MIVLFLVMFDLTTNMYYVRFWATGKSDVLHVYEIPQYYYIIQKFWKHEKS